MQRASSIALVAILMIPHSVSALAEAYPSGTRDWTVEKPFIAGMMEGLSLTLCGSCELGGEPESASDFDPFAMSDVVYEELMIHAALPHALGRWLGLSFILLAGFGFIGFHLNRLKGR